MWPPRCMLLRACIVTLLAALACAAPEADPLHDPHAGAASPAPHIGARLPHPALCERPGSDAVRDLVCSLAPPTIAGLYDLELQLGLKTELEIEGVTYQDQPVLLGHSTSLSGHLVSPINPRAFLVGSDLVLAFQRGVQRVEIAARDRDRERFNLYLLQFTQACNTLPEGCSYADVYTARIESDWESVEVQDDEDLKNTASDCRQCHQRGRVAPRLLMRELESPWTHFFDRLPPSSGAAPGVRGSDLMQDYIDAHGLERYGGVDVANYPAIAPFALERMVGRDQPLLFDTRLIEQERWPLQHGRYAQAPLPSASWEQAFGAFRRGEQLALPYVEVRATDPDKQARLSAAYRDRSSGELPDLADIFPDDPDTRARIGLTTTADASGVETLIQACGPCHNSVLDQSISRARFNIDLSRVEPSELDVAVERISRAPSQPGVMPPPEARQLTDETRERLLHYLLTQARKQEAVPELVTASALGMTRGGP